MQQKIQWHCFDNGDQIAVAASKQILNAATKAIGERGKFKLVLAGGNTPAKVYGLLAESAADWANWVIYYGDERCLPAEHPERNSQLAIQALLSKVAIPASQIFTIEAELGPEQGAERYCDIVANAMPFDMVMLGVGEDAHTASLFPKHVHNVDDLMHPVYNSPKPPSERVSMSAKVLSNTAELMFLVTGSNKQDAIKGWRAGADLPVAHILPPLADIYIDTDALPAE